MIQSCCHPESVNSCRTPSWYPGRWMALECRNCYKNSHLNNTHLLSLSQEKKDGFCFFGFSNIIRMYFIGKTLNISKFCRQGSLGNSSQASGPGNMKKDLKRPEWSMKNIECQELVFSELTIFNFNWKKCLSPGKSGLGVHPRETSSVITHLVIIWSEALHTWSEASGNNNELTQSKIMFSVKKLMTLNAKILLLSRGDAAFC